MHDSPASQFPVTTRTIDVPAADGTADTLVVHPASGGPFPAVLLYMDAFGIRPALAAHAERLARHGYCVFAPNVFYRHGPAPVSDNLEQLMDPANREKLFAELGPRMGALSPDVVRSDAATWLTFIGDTEEALDGPIGTVGYCMGGRLALCTAGEFPDRVTAAASFHGGRLATDADDSPHLVAVKAEAEIYLGHADNDQSMPPAQMAKLTEALADAHVRHTSELYVGAGHGWTQTDTAAYNEPACEHHWSRLVELFSRTLAR